jgi:hypothetical protein
MMADSEASGTAAGRALRTAARILLVVSFALLTQFLLGMVVNLFVTISKAHPGAGVGDYVVGAAESVAWAVTHMWPFLALHVLLGLTLVVSSLTFFVRGLRNRRRTGFPTAGAIGSLGALLAAGSGMYFLIYPDMDAASMLMATGFAIALGAVIVQLYLMKRARS